MSSRWPRRLTSAILGVALVAAPVRAQSAPAQCRALVDDQRWIRFARWLVG
jgi:hypothetical protein